MLDAGRRELRRAGSLVAVEPQGFDLIDYLVRHRDRVVTRDDLLDAIWNGRVVSESTLSSRINAARRALNDTGEEQRLIRTFARKGVRFVGEAEKTNTRRRQGLRVLARRDPNCRFPIVRPLRCCRSPI